MKIKRFKSKRFKFKKVKINKALKRDISDIGDTGNICIQIVNEYAYAYS